MKTAQRLILLLIISLQTSGLCRAANDFLELAEVAHLIDLERYSVMEECPFVILSDYDVTEAPAMPDSLFNALAIGVRFKVNRTELQDTCRFLRKYHSLVSFLRQEGYQLRHLYLRGAASPEGPYENNRRLGKERAAALMSLIQRDLVKNPDLKPLEMNVQSITEDYGYLVDLMQQRNDVDYARVKKLVEDCNGDELACKRRLRRLDGGRVWNRLYKEYFPELRSARIVLWLTRPEPVVEEPVTEPEPVVEPEPEPEVVIPQDTVVEPAPVIIEAPVYTRRHLIALRTNLLHDFFYMPQFGWAMSPNVQLEYYPLDGHYTYNIGMTWGTHRHWDTQEFFQVRDFEFEVRRYFRGGGDFTGLYAGAYAQGDVYGIGLSPTKGWQGEGGGAGLSLGYVMPLNRKGNLRLEFMLAAGVLLTYHDPYVYGNPITGTIDDYYYYDYLGSATDFKKRNHRFTWIGPTNLGVQLTYDIIYRKKKIKR